MQSPNLGSGFKIAMSLLLTSLLIVVPWAEAFAGQAATNPAQAGNQPRLNIVIVEGEGAINNLRQRVAREVIVQVNDENNRPIGGAAVSFLLPTSGPGGAFANGTNVLSVATDATGRAVAGFTPNTVSGTFQVSATASYQGQVATAAISQTNALAAAGAAAGGAAGAGTAVGGVGGGISAATIAVIAAAAVGALAAGVVVSQKGDDGGGGSNPPPGTTPTVSIGVGGTPTIGAPGGWQQSVKPVPALPKWRP